MKKEYAIITWTITPNFGPLPIMKRNKHGFEVLKTYKSLKIADKEAYKIEKSGYSECRVISLDSVHE